jgi:hypothetical protein
MEEITEKKQQPLLVLQGSIAKKAEASKPAFPSGVDLPDSVRRTRLASNKDNKGGKGRSRKSRKTMRSRKSRKSKHHRRKRTMRYFF